MREFSQSEDAKREERIARGTADALSEALEEDISLKRTGNTYEIETDALSLSFVVHPKSFEIRDIKSREKGVGSAVLEAIHDYCDEVRLDVYASNVKDDAETFWQKMGYQDGGGQEYFRAG